MNKTNLILYELKDCCAFYAIREKPGKKVYNWLFGRNEVTSEEMPIVITGPRNQWVSSVKELVENYNLFDGSPLDPESISNMRIRIIPNSNKVWARQIGLNENIQVVCPDRKLLTTNGGWVPHGKGDFIIFPVDKNGKTSRKKRTVINGIAFLDAYKKVEHKVPHSNTPFRRNVTHVHQ